MKQSVITTETLNKEMLKLKALINQKQNSAVYSIKAKETQQLTNGTSSLSINGFSQFAFQPNNTDKSPVMIDSVNKSILNIKHINNIDVADIENYDERINQEIKDRIAADNLKVDNTTFNSTVDSINVKLNKKADKTHNHDDTYLKLSDYHPGAYDDTELRAMIATKADSTHEHDDKYLLKSESYDDSALKSSINQLSVDLTNNNEEHKDFITFKSLMESDTEYSGEEKLMKLAMEVAAEHRKQIEEIRLSIYDDSEVREMIATKADDSAVKSSIAGLQSDVQYLQNIKSDVDHNHDDSYFTKDEMNTLLLTKAATQHRHTIEEISDFEQYVEAGIATALDTKADKTHNHDDDYIKKSILDKTSELHRSVYFKDGEVAHSRGSNYCYLYEKLMNGDEFQLDFLVFDTGDYTHVRFEIKSITGRNGNISINPQDNYIEVWKRGSSDIDLVTNFSEEFNSVFYYDESRTTILNGGGAHHVYLHFKNVYNEVDDLTIKYAFVIYKDNGISSPFNFEYEMVAGVYSGISPGLNMIYPIGSVYTTTNSQFNPNDVFGGWWKQIEDRYLYAVNSETEPGPGGDASIATSHLPQHSHTFTTSENGDHSHSVYHQGYYRFDGVGERAAVSRNRIADDSNDEIGWTNTTGKHSHSGTTNLYGVANPTPYKPLYYGVYAWERIA